MSETTSPLAWLHPFTRPKDVLEALDRSIEWAEDEKRWCTGGLFEHRSAGIKPDLNLPPTQLCTSVKACAIGIVIIVCFDGKAIREHFKGLGDYTTEEVVLEWDATVYRQTVTALYLACEQLDPTVDDKLLPDFEQMFESIEGLNDRVPWSGRGFERARHHQKIVSLFRSARSIAEERK